MKFLEEKENFTLNLTNLHMQVGISVFKLINGVVLDTYGQIIEDVISSDKFPNKTTFSSEIFEEILNTQNKAFVEKFDFSNNPLFFLQKSGIDGSYRWVEILGWDDNRTYATADNPNSNSFVEPWRNAQAKKILLENSNFLVMTSKTEISEVFDEDDDDVDGWASREAHSIVGSSFRQR